MTYKSDDELVRVGVRQGISYRQLNYLSRGATLERLFNFALERLENECHAKGIDVDRVLSSMHVHIELEGEGLTRGNGS